MFKSKVLFSWILIFTVLSFSGWTEILPIESYVKSKERKKKDKPESKSYQLAACLFFQNEAPYLKEWLEYHRLIGFEHFYLFNNESSDEYLKVLAPYIKRGIVELEQVPGISTNQREHATKQYAAYRKILEKTSGKVKWLALIDADEFIVPIQKDKLIDVLNDYEDFGGLYVNWLMFGTSGYKQIPKEKLMIEALTYGLPDVEMLGKSIVRPERVLSCTDAHRMFYHSPYEHVNTNYEQFDALCPRVMDKLVINHYYTRDQDHLMNVKFPRRKKWENIDPDAYRQMGENINIIQHTAIQRFVPELRKRMKMD